MESEMNEIIGALATRQDRTIEEILAELQQNLNQFWRSESRRKHKIFKSKPSLEEYVIGSYGYILKEIAAEQRIKNAGLTITFSSIGMNEAQVMVYLIEQVQHAADKLGERDFSLARILRDCRPKSFIATIAKIKEYAECVDTKMTKF